MRLVMFLHHRVVALRNVVLLSFSLMIVLGNHSRAATLEDVFKTEMIGATLRYFEHLAGPPWRVSGEMQTYKLGKCTVIAFVQNETVNGLEAMVSNDCKINFSTALHINGSVSSNPTFGELHRAHRTGTFFTHCLMSCGNAADPENYSVLSGSRATNWIDIVFGVRRVDSAALHAHAEWLEALRQDYKENDIIMGVAECATKYNDIAINSHRDVLIDTIAIGHGIASRYDNGCGS